MEDLACVILYSVELKQWCFNLRGDRGRTGARGAYSIIRYVFGWSWILDEKASIGCKVAVWILCWCFLFLRNSLRLGSLTFFYASE